MVIVPISKWKPDYFSLISPLQSWSVSFEIIKANGPIQSLLFTTNNHSSCHYFKYDLAIWILVHYFKISENYVSVPPEMDFQASACNYSEHFLETRRKKVRTGLELRAIFRSGKGSEESSHSEKGRLLYCIINMQWICIYSCTLGSTFSTLNYFLPYENLVPNAFLKCKLSREKSCFCSVGIHSQP